MCCLTLFGTASDPEIHGLDLVYNNKTSYIKKCENYHVLALSNLKRLSVDATRNFTPVLLSCCIGLRVPYGLIRLHTSIVVKKTAAFHRGPWGDHTIPRTEPMRKKWSPYMRRLCLKYIALSFISALTVPVQVSYGTSMGTQELTNDRMHNLCRTRTVQVPHMRRTAPLRGSQVFNSTKDVKSHAGVVIGFAGHVRSIYGSRTGCLQYLNP